MSPLDWRAIGLLFLPVPAVFAVLAGTGVLAVGPAVIGAFLASGGIALGVARIRGRIDEAQQIESLNEAELHEEFVRQSRLAESYETILDATPEPLLVLRRDRRVLHANRAIIDLLGHDPIDADLTAAIRHPEVIAATAAVLTGKAEERTIEFQRGGAIEQSLVARLVALPNGRTDGPAAVLVLHDLTLIRKATEMRSDFVANVSHELRTPLTAIVGMIETLRGPAKKDAVARERFLALMEEQGSRMTRLVGDLLSLSQIQANEHARPTDTVRVQDILPTVARMLEPHAEKKKISFSIEVDADLPVVLGDADQLQQAFQNLMHNAVKYGRDGSVIRVVGRGEGRDGIVVAVIDQGEGIPEQHLPRLTERFYRVDKARSRAMGGTGLGLAIVKHIVTRHQGRLSIESEVGVGSTFTVSLPVKREGGARD
jgi:two-component system phosphate regulon sensor histidine kinase PhoR